MFEGKSGLPCDVQAFPFFFPRLLKWPTLCCRSGLYFSATFLIAGEPPPPGVLCQTPRSPLQALVPV